MVDARLTLPDVAEAYGLSEQTLLEYEVAGLIAPTLVGQDRFYTVKDRLRIEIIEKGRRLGFSLDEIRQIIEARAQHSTAGEPPDGEKT